jgi:outer membrane protease
MKRLLSVFALSILILAGSMGFGLQQSAAGEEFELGEGLLYLDATLESGYLKGDTTYHISYYEGATGIESELEFPLKTYLIGPKIGWGYKNPQNRDKFQLNIKWLTNIDDGSGKMKDSDWLTDDLDIMEVGSAHPGLDIYSESDIELELHIVDVNAIYKFWPIKNLSIGPIVGYKFQQFKYDVSDTNQVGYGPYAPIATASVLGKTLDYKVKYHIPYFGLNSDFLIKNKFQINAKINYSPYTTAKDEDDHILRYKLSKGDTDGYAYFANLNAQWNFLSNFFFTIGAEYMRIHTTGTQHQSFYAGPLVGLTADVDDKITSSQWFFSAMITYRFSGKLY